MNVRILALLGSMLAAFPQLQAQAPSPRAIWLEIPELKLSLQDNDARVLPTDKLTYVRIHLNRQPHDVTYSSVSVRVNAEVANIVSTQRALEEGMVSDIDLTRNPSLALHPGRNSVEVTFKDRWNQPHYASFLLEVPCEIKCNPAPLEPPRPPGGRRYAVVIGVAHYSYAGRGVRNLSYADSDAAAVRDFLASPHGGNVPPANIKLLLNEDATLDNIRLALTQFLAGAHPTDTVILYINLHGGADPNEPDRKYLLAYDSDPRNLQNTGLLVMDLPNLLTVSANTKHIVAMADTCHALEIGDSPRSTSSKPLNLVSQYLVRAADMQGMAALEASDIGEISAEGEAWGGGHGVFTYYLLKGLGGAADANGDGTVTAEELFRYVQREVSKATHDSQLPMTAVGQQGGVPLAGVLSGRSNDERAAKH